MRLRNTGLMGPPVERRPVTRARIRVDHTGKVLLFARHIVGVQAQHAVVRCAGAAGGSCAWGAVHGGGRPARGVCIQTKVGTPVSARGTRIELSCVVIPMLPPAGRVWCAGAHAGGEREVAMQACQIVQVRLSRIRALSRESIRM